MLAYPSATRESPSSNGVRVSIRAAFASEDASRLAGLITGGMTLEDRLHQWQLAVRAATFWMVTLGLAAWLVFKASQWLKEHPIQQTAPTTPSRLGLLHLGLWFGLISGAGEGYYIAMRALLIGRPADWAWTTNGNTALLAPLAQVATFATSLAPAWTGGNFAEHPIVSSMGGQVSIVFRGYHYMIGDEDHEELYDLSDPAEEDDLAGSLSAVSTLRMLRAIADSVRRSGR